MFGGKWHGVSCQDGVAGVVGIFPEGAVEADEIARLNGLVAVGAYGEEFSDHGVADFAVVEVAVRRDR